MMAAKVTSVTMEAMTKASKAKCDPRAPAVIVVGIVVVTRVIVIGVVAAVAIAMPVVVAISSLLQESAAFDASRIST
jgi:hypothetical protein